MAAFFSTTKKGELYELQSELNGNDEAKKVIAAKRVIAAHTLGRDVSSLFVAMIKNISTTNLELKRLVYLYVLNYAKIKPELSILGVSTFTRDSESRNPLIRALAIRTMSSIQVPQVLEHLTEPLRRTLEDSDPYVRKTAAVCVAKVFAMNPDMARDQGFLTMLLALVSDSNPMVVANAVAALAEISAEAPDEGIFEINTEILNNLLAALSECTEWGQVAILDALVAFSPRDAREAEHIIERILPRLVHANPAVVLSAVKIILLYMPKVTDEDFARTSLRKMTPPLVSLLSTEPEIQYVVLRNLDLIVQKYPLILRNEMKMFFCKYYDPLYVKLEKMELMIKLVSARNYTEVLSEFRAYANEVDATFVRKAVRAIGRTAVKLPTAAEACINALMGLIVENSTAEYANDFVVQEVVVAMKDIFRRYPGRYEGILGDLCAALEYLEEPEAKAAMIWIIGEYAGKIDNSVEILEAFVDDWDDEGRDVRLQLLTAVVKCYLKRPDEAQVLVETVLRVATENTLTPDIRDRAYVYWRLLSTNTDATKEVVVAEKPVISNESDNLELPVLNMLLRHISSLASVYHKPPELFLSTPVTFNDDDDDEYADELEEDPAAAIEAARAAYEESMAGPSSSGGGATPGPGPSSMEGGAVGGGNGAPVAYGVPGGGSGGGVDLLGGDLGGSGSAPPLVDLLGGDVPNTGAGGSGSGGTIDLLGDLLGGGSTATATPTYSTAATVTVPKQTWLTAEAGGGMAVTGAFARRNGVILMEMSITNMSQGPMSDFAVLFNKNTFGAAAGQMEARALGPGESFDAAVPVAVGGEMAVMNPLMLLQVALKNNVDVYYFATSLPLDVLFVEGAAAPKETFLPLWKSIANFEVANLSLAIPTAQLDAYYARLADYNVFLVAAKDFDDRTLAYFSAATANGMAVLYEVAFSPSGDAQVVNVKMQVEQFVPDAVVAISRAMTLATM